MLRASLLFALIASITALKNIATPMELPWGWNTHPATSDEAHTIQIALHGRNSAEMAKLGMEISDPKSAKYSQYMTSEEIGALTGPTPEARAAVAAWLSAEGMEFKFGATGNVVAVTAAPEKLAYLLSTTVELARNVLTGQSVLRFGNVNVPDTVAEHVRAVFGVHGLPLPPKAKLADPVPNPCNVTPDVLETRYRVSGVTPSGSTANRQAVAEFQQQTFNPADLVQFFKAYVPNAKSGDDKVYKYVGQNNPDNSGIEAALDIEYIMGVAPGLKSEFWEFPAMDFCSDLVKWTQEILSQSEPPNVFSVSYGWQGNLSQLHCTDAEVNTVDDEFNKLALKGVSIIFASGDSGSGYDPSGGCGQIQPAEIVGTPLKTIDNGNFETCCKACGNLTACQKWSFNLDKKICNLYATGKTKQINGVYSGPAPQPSVLWPSWPASSPWVTAVGSTRFVNNKAGADEPEMATDQFGSGGGFSFQFDAPAYQKDAIAAFMKEETKLPPAGMYAPGGRATPDVAALGEGFLVVGNAHVMPVGGTSASAPTFSGIISLVNEKRIAAGKKPLGFLNQWIYQNAGNFMDVTVGDNRRGRGEFTLPYGYDCEKGWDPVSGMGTPDFSKMVASALALP